MELRGQNLYIPNFVYLNYIIKVKIIKVKIITIAQICKENMLLYLKHFISLNERLNIYF